MLKKLQLFLQSIIPFIKKLGTIFEKILPYLKYISIISAIILFSIFIWYILLWFIYIIKKRKRDFKPVGWNEYAIIIAVIFGILAIFLPLLFQFQLWQYNQLYILSLAIILFSAIFIPILVPFTQNLKKKIIIKYLENMGLVAIQYYLKKDVEKCLKERDKDEKKGPHFFRWEGPLWIDFEKGYISEREEVNTIIKDLDKKQVFLTGIPASGKSVILRNIGYELAKKGKNVFIIPFKEVSEVKNKPKIVSLLKEINAYLFLDDIHLNKKEADYFYRNINKKILFSGRKPQEIEESRIDELDRRLKEGTEIHPDKNIKEKIIKRFQYISGCRISDNIFRELLNIPNLLLLSLQLEMHIEDKGEIKELRPITEGIKSYIEELKAEDIFLPIALFYQYEVPVRRRFLEQNLSLDKEKIDELIKVKREILSGEWKKREYLSLYHSEIAKAFIDTYKEYKDLGWSVKEKLKLNGHDWEVGGIYIYLNSFPEEGNYFFSKAYREISIALSKHPEFPTLIKNIFENAEYFDFNCYWAYTKYLPKENSEKINEIKSSTFEEKIRKWDDPEAIALLLFTLNEIKYERLKELLKRLEVTLFEEKIRKWDDPWAIAKLLSTLNEVKYERLKELLKRLEVTLFEEKIRKWDNPWDIEKLLSTLNEVKYERLKELEVTLFEEKIRKWDDPWAIAELLSTLNEVKYERLKELLMIEPEFFFNLLKTRPVEEYIKFLGTLEKLNYPHIKKLKELLKKD